MFEIDESTVSEYLRAGGRIGALERVRVDALSGGVSNVVLRVEPERSEPFILKQSRQKLRTEADWFSRLDRIWRETAMLETLAEILPAGAVPRVLFEDRDNYTFAMQAAPADHTVWKEELLAGRIRPEVAVRLAGYLSAMHAQTAGDAGIDERFGDREIFVQLRVDPFYRRVAEKHENLREALRRLIDEMWATRACLVHADFSPKNVLVWGEPRGADEASRLRVLLIDFETGHYGDPAFDLGFFLSHLLLKGVLAGSRGGEFAELIRTFWEQYRAGIKPATRAPGFRSDDLERRAVANLAGCALARIDGTSPVGYLPDESQRQRVRGLCREILLRPLVRLPDVLARLESGTDR
jgi:5-methylthioribose kinase